MIKAADMMIARRADTRARADFATWKMMAKLNGASSLPAEAQAFLASYQALLKQMPEATRPTPPSSSCTRPITRRWVARVLAPDVRAQMSEPVADNVTAFRRPAPQKPQGPKPGESQAASYRWH